MITCITATLLKFYCIPLEVCGCISLLFAQELQYYWRCSLSVIKVCLVNILPCNLTKYCTSLCNVWLSLPDSISYMTYKFNLHNNFLHIVETVVIFIPYFTMFLKYNVLMKSGEWKLLGFTLSIWKVKCYADYPPQGMNEFWKYSIWLNSSKKDKLHTHSQMHTHTHIRIYIYMYKYKLQNWQFGGI